MFLQNFFVTYDEFLEIHQVFGWFAAYSPTGSVLCVEPRGAGALHTFNVLTRERTAILVGIRLREDNDRGAIRATIRAKRRRANTLGRTRRRKALVNSPETRSFSSEERYPGTGRAHRLE